MPIDPTGLGKRIRGYREQLELTQAALAERAGLYTTYMSQVERGVKLPSLEALSRIAKALKVAPGALLDVSGPPKADPLMREIQEILGAWPDKQRRALLRALRSLAELLS